jgi:hypothetical protein
MLEDRISGKLRKIDTRSTHPSCLAAGYVPGVKDAEEDFMKLPQNTPPFMAGMNAVQGYRGCNPLPSFSRCPAF